ncbi:unnamed protein product [Phytophthora lilii]|uniref:Unnamed protein product n=1 Tax=Phytophthora lilii TaxID=2077276 RepID=A0A9W6XV57_9STRA|nr:unnamed protein product [Phytophthora lilii]
MRFQFTLKRSSMKIHGQSNFSMFANPTVSNKNTMVLYDVFAAFAHEKTLRNYTLVNGIAYLSDYSYSSSLAANANAKLSVNCLDSESGNLPAVNAIVAALNQATAIPSVSEGNNTALSCSSNILYKVTVNGIDFALCAMGASGFTMHGSDLDISVEFLESHLDIQLPTAVATTKGECPIVAKLFQELILQRPSQPQ